MQPLIRFFRHRLTLMVLGLLCLSAVIWWIGPLVAIADVRPLAPAWLRLLLILGVVAFFAGREGWRAWQARKAERALAAAQEPAAPAATPAADAAELAVLKQRFEEALKLLRQRPGRSWLDRGQSVYDLPWYMFIGAPGSGKTTALQHSGLTFPLAAKLGQGAVQGVGGTRNCDWWFTEQAVLIDTAGRYTTQQSDAAADAAGWLNFLKLLRRHRPRRPLNGVLLTLSVPELLQRNEAARAAHAAHLRARLQELNEQLGLRLPVYVLVTKADLIAGFNETFGQLGRDEREQALGFTVDLDPQAKVAAALSAVNAGIGALTQRLQAQVVPVMQTDAQPLRRAAIFAFPQQFDGVRSLLMETLGQVFDGGGGFEERMLLRGVYFASGTQEGTPIDRVMGALARSYGVERPLPALAGTPKSFFLLRVLRDVVFAEAGLAGLNRRAEATRRLLRTGSFAALGLVGVGLVAGWTVSALRNKSYALEVDDKLPALRQALAAVPPPGSADLGGLLNALNALRDAAQPQGWSLQDPPLSHGLGLYQGDKLDAGARIAYERVLQNALLPRVAQRTDELLRSASRSNLEFAYEALKAYLVLRTPQRFDADTLKAWIALDWEQNQGRQLSAEQRQQLEAHLDALLALGAPLQPPASDAALVGSVRDMLAQIPTEVRLYGRLKRQRMGADIPDFSVVSAAGSTAAQVFERASGEPLTKGVPGLFTRDGYHKGFKAALARAGTQLQAEEVWVLGLPPERSRLSLPGGVAGIGGQDAVSQAVRRLYLEDYIKVWDAYLADVRLVRMGGLERNVQIARTLAAPDSPLMRYVRAAAKETSLVDSGGPAASLAQKIDEKAASAKKEIAALIGAGDAAPSGPTAKPEQFVDDHFAPLRRLVEGTPPPLDEVQKKFNEVYVQLAAVEAAQKSKSPPPPTATAERLKAEAGLNPEPIRSMLEALADAGVAQSRNAERQTLTSDLKPITEFCQRSVAGRYPFAAGAQGDVPVEDFAQLFGQGGQLQEFFDRRLAALVDTGTTPWSYRPLSDGAKPAAAAALADFQRAARIREVFFRSGGKTPGFRLDLRLAEVSDGVKEVTLDWDGQVSRFAGAGSSAPLSWPSSRVASTLKLSLGSAVASFEGPWALFRMFDRFEVQPGAQPEKFSVTVNLDGKRARFEVTASTVFNPFRLREMQQFRCPGAL